MNAEQFLDHLAARDLLEPAVIEQFRANLKGHELSPQQLLKALVVQGHLTSFQAESIGNEISAEAGEAEEEVIDLSQMGGDEVVDLAQLGGDNEIVSLDELEEIEEVIDLEAANEPLPSTVPGQSNPSEIARSVGPKTLHDADFDNTVWDSKFILGGVLVLGLLCVTGVVLFLVLSNRNADEAWDLAKADFDQGMYAQAKPKLETYSQDYPERAEANEAIVMAALCDVHLAIGSLSRSSLETVQEALIDVQNNPEFPKQRGVLPSLLLIMYDGYASAAENSPEPEDKQMYLDLCDQTLALLDNPAFVSKKLLNEGGNRQKKIAVEQRIQDVRRIISRKGNLDSAIVQINEFSIQKLTAQAYAIRDTLLQQFPELKADPTLVDAVREVSRQERELVAAVAADATMIPTSDDVAVEDRYKIIVATRNGRNISGVQDYFAPVLVNESLYGVEVWSGKVVWRRHLAQRTMHPVRVDDQRDSNTIAADGDRNEIVCLETATGRLIWRTPVGGVFTQPVVNDRKIYVNRRVSKAGRTISQLVALDAGSGDVQQIIEFPMLVLLPPAFDQQNGLIYQVGEHSNIYVVDPSNGRCQAVHYTGHEEGEISVPAVVVAGYLFYAENADGKSFVRIYQQQEDKTFLPVQERLEIEGNIVIPMSGNAAQITIATNLGGINVFDVDPNSTPVVSVMANIPKTLTTPTRQFFIRKDGLLWTAGRNLAKYKVQAILGQITPVTIGEPGDIYLTPLQAHEDVVVHVRQRQGTAAVTVSGHPAGAVEPAWETDIGGNVSALLSPQQNRTVAVSSDGGSQTIESDGQGTVVVDSQRSETVNWTAGGFSNPQFFGQNQVVLQGASGAHEVQLIDFSGDAPAVTRVSLQGARGNSTADSIAFSGGVVVPYENGEINMYSLPSGERIVLPFQATLRPRQTTQWSNPVLPEDDADSFVIMQDRNQLFRIALVQSPRPHLSALARRVFEDDVVYDRVAALADTVYVIARQVNNDQMIGLSSAELREQNRLELQGRVSWGPIRLGNQVLLTTDKGGLYCFGTGQSLVWQNEQFEAQPIGKPSVAGQAYLIATRDGSLKLINPTNGSISETIETSQTISDSPVVISNRAFLPTSDGGLAVIELGQAL